MIFCSTFFAASFAGWNFSRQEKEAEPAQQASIETQSKSPNRPTTKSDSNPSKNPEQLRDNESTRQIKVNHKQWVKSHLRCSDCHTGAGETNRVEQLSEQYHAKKADTEETESAFLGVITREIPGELRSHLELKDSSHGVMIEKVLDESPAFHCGLEEHDILVSIDDADVIGTEGLSQIIRAQQPKSKISIRYIHQGKVESLSLVLGRHKTPDMGVDFEIKGCRAKMAASTNCSSCHKSK